MAIYIQMKKVYEDNKTVIYEYGMNESVTGKIGYEKSNKQILDIEPLIINGEKKDYLFHKSAQKLVVTAHEENNTFPDKLIIAS